MRRESSSTTTRSLSCSGRNILLSSLQARSHTLVHLTAPSTSRASSIPERRGSGHSTSQRYSLRRSTSSRLISSHGLGFGAFCLARFFPTATTSSTSGSPAASAAENARPERCTVSSAVETFLSPARSVLASRRRTRSAVSSFLSAVLLSPAIEAVLAAGAAVELPAVAKSADKRGACVGRMVRHSYRLG